IPQPDGLIGTRRCEKGAVGRKGQAGDPRLIPREFTNALTAFGVPELNRPVGKPGAGRNHIGRGRDGYRGDCFLVRVELKQFCTSGRFMTDPLATAPTPRDAIAIAEEAQPTEMDTASPARMLDGNGTPIVRAPHVNISCIRRQPLAIPRETDRLNVVADGQL